MPLFSYGPDEGENEELLELEEKKDLNKNEAK